jgi:hypothetical protein
MDTPAQARLGELLKVVAGLGDMEAADAADDISDDGSAETTAEDNAHKLLDLAALCEFEINQFHHDADGSDTEGDPAAADDVQDPSEDNEYVMPAWILQQHLELEQQNAVNQADAMQQQQQHQQQQQQGEEEEEEEEQDSEEGYF